VPYVLSAIPAKCHGPILGVNLCHHYSNPDPISDLTYSITPVFGQYPEPQYHYHTCYESLALRSVCIKTKWCLTPSHSSGSCSAKKCGVIMFEVAASATISCNLGRLYRPELSLSIFDVYGQNRTQDPMLSNFFMSVNECCFKLGCLSLVR
jgi:hypothetical protein